MEQFHTSLSSEMEENKSVVVPHPNKVESPLLNKVRQNFGLFGGISFLFGLMFTIWFYDTGMGLNVFAFTIVMVVLLTIIMKQLTVTIKQGTIAYYLGALLLGISTTLTSSETLQLLNVIGIMMLLDLSLLHQLYEDHRWDFSRHLGFMFGLIFQSIISLGLPFIDCVQFMKQTKVLKNDRVRNILIGFLISLPFLFVITALLSGADLLFGAITKDLYSTVFSSDIFFICFMILFGFLACYCIICGAVSKSGIEIVKERRKGDTSIAVTAMTLLSLVYILFCGIQIVYLFSNGLFILPEGFTFADYARRGFFELLAVTIINIVLILLCDALFQNSKVLRIILTGITVCTYIMIASATYRMLLYIGAYQLTFLRLFVLLVLFMDAFVLAGVIITVYRKSFPLFPYCVAVISVCYIAFSLAKPDYYIASYLSEHKEQLNAEDAVFLTQEVSPDAAPIVLPLLADSSRWSSETVASKEDYNLEYTGEYSQYHIQSYYDKITNVNMKQSLRDFNYAYYTAGDYIKQYPVNKVVQK
jgi:hypothetical protein